MVYFLLILDVNMRTFSEIQETLGQQCLIDNQKLWAICWRFQFHGHLFCLFFVKFDFSKIKTFWRKPCSPSMTEFKIKFYQHFKHIQGQPRISMKTSLSQRNVFLNAALNCLLHSFVQECLLVLTLTNWDRISLIWDSEVSS